MNKRMILYIQGAIFADRGGDYGPADCGGAHLPRTVRHLVFLYGAGGGDHRICGNEACKAAQQDDLCQEGLIAVAAGWIVCRWSARCRLRSRGDSDLSRRGVRNDLGLYNDRFEHPAECGGAQPLHAALAELFPLAGRHGHSGVHAGNCQKWRAGRASICCVRRAPDPRSARWCRGWSTRRRFFIPYILP